ncbi:uncharacterized protein B0H64DRAFT_97695 [Chaetomium fimeti]|uniref:Uncharacterized protein n=1 Tax=Chaetomium fimeti TaxID=1854472 RepID=A0AAE0HP88_9PEZI|nr:hypothetical protein B0H64DRAFT_97695 [Chaetomium fimeti]
MNVDEGLKPMEGLCAPARDTDPSLAKIPHMHHEDCSSARHQPETTFFPLVHSKECMLSAGPGAARIEPFIRPQFQHGTHRTPAENQFSLHRFIRTAPCLIPPSGMWRSQSARFTFIAEPATTRANSRRRNPDPVCQASQAS